MSSSRPRTGWLSDPTTLTSELTRAKEGRVTDDERLAGIWTATNDVRTYVIVGGGDTERTGRAVAG